MREFAGSLDRLSPLRADLATAEVEAEAAVRDLYDVSAAQWALIERDYD